MYVYVYKQPIETLYECLDIWILKTKGLPQGNVNYRNGL